MRFRRACALGWLGLHVRDDRGATAVEYGLIAVLVAAVITMAVGAFGTAVASLFVLSGLLP